MVQLFNSIIINNYFKFIEKNQKKSFLDILFSVLEDDPEQMTDKDIREEVDTFLFEGHDTSSLALAMTLVLLGIYKDIQVSIQPMISKLTSRV